MLCKVVWIWSNIASFPRGCLGWSVHLVFVIIIYSMRWGFILQRTSYPNRQLHFSRHHFPCTQKAAILWLFTPNLGILIPFSLHTLINILKHLSSFQRRRIKAEQFFIPTKSFNTAVFCDSVQNRSAVKAAFSNLPCTLTRSFSQILFLRQIHGSLSQACCFATVLLNRALELTRRPLPLIRLSVTILVQTAWLELSLR
jgi:hypothetical protein